MNPRTKWIAAVAIVAVTLGAPAHAGRPCVAKRPSTQAVERGLTLAQRTMVALDASGAQVVVLARAGQDLTRYGLHYSHVAFAYKQPDANGGSVWRVVHKLNSCGTASSDIYRQGLGEFFLDDPWRFEAAWVVPTSEVQGKLLPFLKDDRRVASLHHKQYSVVAYVWSRKYQQSNQWLIESMAAAIEPGVTSRDRAQAWLQFKGYQPSTLNLGPLERLGGRMGSANVAFDDHPDVKRFTNRIETVTADSVFTWLQRSGLGGAPATLRLP
jgi:hypothetical protein